jgi:hypothetical protein
MGVNMHLVNDARLPTAEHCAPYHVSLGDSYCVMSESPPPHASPVLFNAGLGLGVGVGVGICRPRSTMAQHEGTKLKQVNNNIVKSNDCQ